jgi:hypothetical protein
MCRIVKNTRMFWLWCRLHLMNWNTKCIKNGKFYDFTIYFYNLNLYYIFMSYKKYIFNNFDYVQSSTSSSSQWCYACLQQMCGLSSTTSFIFSSLFCLSSHYKNKKLYFYLVFVFNLFFIFLIAIYFILF